MQVLGGGGFGITYLAWDSLRERHVVIKECLPADYACREEGSLQVRPISPETERMFHDCLANIRQEAEVLAQFSNSGVVQIYDLFEENGTFYYAMEYLQGQTLHDIMMQMRSQGQPMSPEQAEGLLFHVVDILSHMHEQKIYHCDIKPGNIFITADGKPKLIDFGAVRSKELQHQGLVQITPGYTPPEFYPGSLRELGPWSDIYELGATFYELLTGKVPDPSDQRIKVDRMVKISSMDNMRSLYSLPFLSSIDKALMPDHHDRFRTAQAWCEFIDSYAGGRQLKTINPNSSAGMRFKAAGMPNLHKKKKGVGGFVAFVVVLAVAGIVGLCIHNGTININGDPKPGNGAGTPKADGTATATTVPAPATPTTSPEDPADTATTIDLTGTDELVESTDSSDSPNPATPTDSEPTDSANVSPTEVKEEAKETPPASPTANQPAEDVFTLDDEPAEITAPVEPVESPASADSAPEPKEPKGDAPKDIIIEED